MRHMSDRVVVWEATRLGAVALLVALGTGCLALSTDDVAHMFNPKLKMTVDDPFEGARVESNILPITVDIKGATHDVVVTLSIDGIPNIPVLTWPEQDHADVQVDLVLGLKTMMVTAMEEHTTGDEDRFRADVERTFELVGSGWPATDYPLPTAVDESAAGLDDSAP